jgi:hypothetical protein
MMTHEAETISCLETSRNNYRSTQGNIPDERKPHRDRATIEEAPYGDLMPNVTIKNGILSSSRNDYWWPWYEIR